MNDSNPPVATAVKSSIISNSHSATLSQLDLYTNLAWSLIFVIGLIVVVAWLVKRSRLYKLTHRLINVHDSYQLSSKVRIVVLEVNQQLLVVGITAQQMTLLHTINPVDSQAILAQQSSRKSSVKSQTFHQLLQVALNRKKPCD